MRAYVYMYAYMFMNIYMHVDGLIYIHEKKFSLEISNKK